MITEVAVQLDWCLAHRLSHHCVDKTCLSASSMRQRAFKFTFHVAMYKYLREDNEVNVLISVFVQYHFIFVIFYTCLLLNR